MTTNSVLYKVDPINDRNWEMALQCIDMWANERGISDKATAEAQALKTLEEAQELYQAVGQAKAEDVKLEIGDVLVTLQIQARKQGLSLFDCLCAAYNKIKHRDGRMENGAFVRDKSAD